MPLRAVIFDYGQVLSKPAQPGPRAQLLAITGLAPEVFDNHYWKYRLDYDRGTLNGRTYWQSIARDAALALTPVQIESLIEQDVLLWATVDPMMLNWLTRIQASGLKTAILSNMGEDLLAHMRRHFSWFDGFHHLTWSCELDMIKPEAAIYRHTIEKLKVLPGEALFLDDKIENVEGARRAGMHAIQFTGVATLQMQLDREGWADQLPPVISPGEKPSAEIAQPGDLRHK